MTEAVTTKITAAVIDIGSSAIRMIVAELGTKEEIRQLENLQKPIRLGKDVFINGRIGNNVMHEAVEILKNYKSVATGYGVKKIQTIATSAVREATNRDMFLDQVFVRTGLDIEVLEGPEENRLELIAVESALGTEFDLEKKNCLIVEVGSGGTEMIVLNQGKVEVTRSLSIGSIRLPEQSVAGKTLLADMQRILKRSIREVASYVATECSLDQVDVFIGLGADMRFVARQLCTEPPERFSVLEKKAFENFVSKLSKKTAEEITQEFGMTYTEAETLYPSLLFYDYFLAETKSEQVVIPMTSIRDALLLEMAQMISGYKRTDLSKQVLNSARHLGEKFHYDKGHGLVSASLSIRLFDLLQSDHGMGSRERLLLEVAALLHDIGTYISTTSHNKHSSYMINASEIFGLRKSDKDIVANVVRYHRRSPPKPTHMEYMSLLRNDRAVVSKLAAILRVADALDRSHKQKIKSFSLERVKQGYVLWVPEEAGDVSIEKAALQEKSDMFLENFGIPITLKQGTPPPEK